MEPEQQTSTLPEAPSPEPEPKLTHKQWGQLRRMHVTIVHGVVRACGHRARFSKDHDPRNNCADCWSAFFATAVDLEFVHAVLTTKGVKELVKLKGKKFAKMLHGFLATQILPALNAEPITAEAATIVGGTFERNREVQSTVPTVQDIG